MGKMTAGEIGDTAYWPALGSLPPVPWAGLSPVVHRAGEAAAQAVRAQAGLLVLDLDPEERRDA
jgi:hypothetical protein